MASQSISPIKPQFTFSTTDPCGSNHQSSSVSPCLQSLPSEPPSPSHPTVKLPGSVSNNEPIPVNSGLDFSQTGLNDTSSPLCAPQIPCPFLYDNGSRKMLQAIDEGASAVAKSFAMTCEQKLPDADFKSCKLDTGALNGRSSQPPADGESAQPMLNNESLLSGAALPHMSKAAPAKASTVTRVDSDFYKYTRSYLLPSKKSPEHSSVVSVATPSSTRGTTSLTAQSMSPILITTNILWWNHMVASLIGNGSTSGGHTCT